MWLRGELESSQEDPMSTRRNALGRGLGALIPSREPDARSHSLPASEAALPGEPAPDATPPGPARLRVDTIDPNPDQPRRHFDERELASLTSSIQRHGVLQPVVVRKAGDRYELLVGERRWRATQAAGLSEIPAVIADVADKERLELAIVENVQRQDLNPIELAHAYRALAESGATQEEIGQRVCKDRSSVANHLRLLELSRQIQEDVESQRLSMGHAKALLQVSNPERRLHLRNRVVKEGLSVRETERVGREIAGPAPGRSAKPRSGSEPPDPHIQALVEALERELQTRVRVKGSAARGRIEIEYFERADLERSARVLLEGG
jgi:ParB family chromosome partitioning protein